jgi:pimeloyl-ACP methyl ester carboxylesterase
MVKLDPVRSPELRAQFIAKYDAVLARWPVPRAERDVSTSFGSTHVVVSGPVSAPPLVLLHGAAATATMWGPVIAALSESYRCYCVDTVTDANKSVATKRVRGVADYVDWLRQTFIALELENARVAGLSYGGWLAANLAVHAPELVNRLLLLCPAATLVPIPAEFYVRVFSTVLLRSSDRAHGFLQWMSATPNAFEDPAMNLIATNMLSSRAMRIEMRPPSVLTDGELGRISAHTTVFIGDREVVYRGGPSVALARAEKFIPNVRAHLVPGGGHVLTVDVPQQLAEGMIAALA